MSLPHTAHWWCCDLPRRADSAAASPRSLVLLASEGTECGRPAFVADSAAASPRSLVLLASEGTECERPAFVALPRTLVSLGSEVADDALVCVSMVSLSGCIAQHMYLYWLTNF